MPIYTVLGPIEPEELGITSMHEHILCDGWAWVEPPLREPMPEDPVVKMENLAFIRHNLPSLADNMIIDDVENAVVELNRYAALGGDGIMDQTSVGFGRRVEDLPDVARRTGLHIMAGGGFYFHNAHPPRVETSTHEELVAELVKELREGIDDTGIRPAMLGEIGTGHPVTDREWKVVRAVSVAAAETGSSVNFHTDASDAHSPDILKVCVDCGMDPGRCVFSHLDERLDYDLHRAVLDEGGVVEYDTWGAEFWIGSAFKDPSDLERAKLVSRLIREGHEKQIVFGCDIWTKASLRKYGGVGYEHLLLRVKPSLIEDWGVSPESLETILVENPRRILDRP